MSNLWMSIEPRAAWTRLLLSEPQTGIALKALLPPQPAQSGALALLLTGMAAWYGRPLCAVFDADAEDGRQRVARWADALDLLDETHVRVEWVTRSALRDERERQLSGLGDFREARRLIELAAAGLR